MVTKDMIRRVPKVELHDHLDGGLRVPTIIELARKENIKLPSYDETRLRDWFTQGCRRGSLSLYLEAFRYTTAVMQSAENLERVAYEAVLDLHRENVVYAEIRLAPDLHTHKGLYAQEAVSAVLDGVNRGRTETGMQVGIILCAMRTDTAENNLKIAEIAAAFYTCGRGFRCRIHLAGHTDLRCPQDRSRSAPDRRHDDRKRFCDKTRISFTVHTGQAYSHGNVSFEQRRNRSRAII